MKNIIIIICISLLGSNICGAASSCEGIDANVPSGGHASQIVSAIEKQFPKKEKIGSSVVVKKIDKYLGKDNWHIVWTSPEGMEQGVFLLQENEGKISYRAVWGGTAFPEDEPDILKWLKSKAPKASPQLLKCAAHFMATGK